jgi:hypothetical protein
VPLGIVRAVDRMEVLVLDPLDARVASAYSSTITFIAAFRPVS